MGTERDDPSRDGRVTACPLCASGEIRPFRFTHGRRYLDCERCALVHLVPADRLDLPAELAHYDTHENDPQDPRYRTFLRRLADPLMERLPPGAEGLDYGSGPAPALSLILRERGFRMRDYDPFFAPDPAALRRTYDFIACSETAEHFAFPGEELERLDRLLRPGGWLGLMTEILQPTQQFERWRYARDPTHVAFYRWETMVWIASRFGWEMSSAGPNVFLFRKSPPAG